MFLCIDLKCFYASVECAERGLDPFLTNLVVADRARGKGTLCLAISPKMKNLGVKNRCRLFQIPVDIKYTIAKPRMKKYIEYSARIYGIYLKYIAKEDIHIYSIDEAFLDITHYHSLYRKDASEIGKMIIADILKTTGITASCGVGSNLFLAKVALDILAKKTADNVALLDEAIFKSQLWCHQPLSDFWHIGSGIERRLKKLGLNTLKDVSEAPEEILYKEFGVNAKSLIEHADGKESTTIADIKNYRAKSKSLSTSQILERDYKFSEALVVIKEMVELLCLDLVSQLLVTSHMSIYVGYSDDQVAATGCSHKLAFASNSYDLLVNEAIILYEKTTYQNHLIRRLGISVGHLLPETQEHYGLFVDIESINKERLLQQKINEIKNKHGKSAVIRATSLDEAATSRRRNKLIGGHNRE